MAISGHRCEANLWNYIGSPSNEQIRACSDILSDRLSGRPHQQSQRPCFTALSSRASFMFQWIRLSFIHKTQALSSLFFQLSWKKIWLVFMSHYSAEFHGTFRFQILYKKLRKLYAKELNSSCRTVFQFVNYSSLWTLTVWIFWQLQFHSTNQIIWTILTRIWIAYFSVLNESIELLTTLSFALEIKSILKLKVMCGEFNGFSVILQLEKYYSICNKYSNMYGKCRE